MFCRFQLLCLWPEKRLTRVEFMVMKAQKNRLHFAKYVNFELLNYKLNKIICFGVCSDSSWRSLQTVQNEAMRISTGCYMMAGIDHLHQETKVLPIRKHAMIRTKQHLLSCFQAGQHPGRKLAKTLKTPRSMKGHI
jgi:hypothetical protein